MTMPQHSANPQSRSGFATNHPKGRSAQPSAGGHDHA